MATNIRKIILTINYELLSSPALTLKKKIHFTLTVCSLIWFIFILSYQSLIKKEVSKQ